MSKIPYSFETPVPKFFRKNGWFDPKKDNSHFKTIVFISWCFSKCSTIKRKVFHDKRQIELDEYEFICGRHTASEETGLTEKEVRGQLFSYEKAGIIKKTANSRANRFTCYKWSTDVFCENEGQLEGRTRANRGPTEGHNLEDRIEKKEEEYISREALNEKVVGIDFVNENFEQPSSEVNTSQVTSSPSKHNVYSQTELTETKPEKTKTKQNKTNKKETIPKLNFRDNVLLTQHEHDELSAKHGQLALDWMLDKLNHHKNASGKRYKSDYSAIHTWVIDAYLKSKSIPNYSNSNTSDIRRVKDINGNFIKNPHEGSF